MTPPAAEPVSTREAIARLHLPNREEPMRRAPALAAP